MDAAIIAVGSEMLTPQRVDTDSLFLTDVLNARGVEVVIKLIVGDDRQRLVSAIRYALSQARLLILTGGLGPTEDDLTREAVAQYCGRPLVFSEEICAAIVQRFQRMNRTMAEVNKRQAYMVEGSVVLPNGGGTAPGLWVEHEGCHIIMLPGPPRELKPIFESQCLPRLEQLLPPQVIRTRFYRVAGMPESDLDQLIAPVYKQYTNPATTILAAAGDIQVHLRARCRTEEEAEALLHEVGTPIEELLGDRLYSRNGNPLEAAIGEMLRTRGMKVAVAESCTGGMLAEKITSVAGSSDYFAGGFLTYSYEAKTALLGIDPELLRENKAVSEPVARAMACAALVRSAASLAVSITGVAGPGQGDETEPVGAIYIGVADKDGSLVRRFQFAGDRHRIRVLAAQTALDMIRRRLIGSTASPWHH
ncbi:MAG: competence/damage-inducible protein A [Bryobacterales bacterium]|nr:competence/damage-inducible protein A [Bryobacterales bacterium]